MEFVVVVAGVLLALWLQERVTNANKQSDAKAAEAAIRDELDSDLLVLVAQNAVGDCRKTRLDQIERRLEDDGPTELILSHWGITASSRPKHPTVYGFFALDVTDTAWRSAMANGSVSAMNPERFKSIADLYANFDQVRDALATDRDAGNTLQILSYQRTLTPELRGELIKAYFTARANRAFLTEGLPAAELARKMRKLGWDDKQHLDALIDGAKQDMRRFGFKFEPCAKPFVNPFNR
jgi:hypothetical protein